MAHNELKKISWAGGAQRVRLGARGRLVLPAKARKRLGLVPGEELLVFVERDTLRLSSVGAHRKRLRGLLRKGSKPGVLRRFLKERRAEE